MHYGKLIIDGHLKCSPFPKIRRFFVKSADFCNFLSVLCVPPNRLTHNLTHTAKGPETSKEQKPARRRAVFPALRRTFWCFSLTKPLVLPGVNKKALANKIRFEVVDLIEKTENIELSESFLMGKKKCFEAVSREYATRSRVQVLPVYGLRGE